MRQIPPLFFHDRYYAGVETAILRVLDDVVYKPLFQAVADSPLEVRNSISALLDAIRRGTVWYDQDHFAGTYSSQITIELRMLGAVFNRSSSTWTLSKEHLPAQVYFAMADADDKVDKLRRKFLSVLDSEDPAAILQRANMTEQYGKTIDMMEGAFQRTISGLDLITIVAKLTDDQKRIIATDWGNNLDLYIKGWAEEAILKLRNDIQPGILAGGRAEGLVRMLQDSYGSSKAKARFLAHQETSLLMSKFRETRYRSLGSDTYKWSTSHDSRVRHDHRELNGTVHRWDSPPIVDRKTGRRCNPGEDWGCRCTAIGLIN